MLHHLIATALAGVWGSTCSHAEHLQQGLDSRPQQQSRHDWSRNRISPVMQLSIPDPRHVHPDQRGATTRVALPYSLSCSASACMVDTGELLHQGCQTWACTTHVAAACDHLCYGAIPLRHLQQYDAISGHSTLPHCVHEELDLVLHDVLRLQYASPGPGGAAGVYCMQDTICQCALQAPDASQLWGNQVPCKQQLCCTICVLACTLLTLAPVDRLCVVAQLSVFRARLLVQMVM